MLNKDEILKISRQHDGKRYVKRFDAYQYVAAMIFGHQKVRFVTHDIRILFAEAHRIVHLSNKNDAKAQHIAGCQRKKAGIRLEETYRSLYAQYKDEISSDSRKCQVPSWLKRLQIIVSTPPC